MNVPTQPTPAQAVDAANRQALGNLPGPDILLHLWR